MANGVPFPLPCPPSASERWGGDHMACKRHPGRNWSAMPHKSELCLKVSKLTRKLARDEERLAGRVPTLLLINSVAAAWAIACADTAKREPRCFAIAAMAASAAAPGAMRGREIMQRTRLSGKEQPRRSRCRKDLARVRVPGKFHGVVEQAIGREHLTGLWSDTVSSAKSPSILRSGFPGWRWRGRSSPAMTS